MLLPELKTFNVAFGAVRLVVVFVLFSFLLLTSSGPIHNSPHLTAPEIVGSTGEVSIVPQFSGGWVLTFEPAEIPSWVINDNTKKVELFQGPYMYNITAGKGVHDVTFEGSPLPTVNKNNAVRESSRESGESGNKYSVSLPDNITDPNTPVPRVKVEQLLPPGYSEIKEKHLTNVNVGNFSISFGGKIFQAGERFSIANACPTVFFLSTRGSGQNDNNTGYGERLGDRGLRIVNSLRDHLRAGYSTVTSYGTSYPAKHVRTIEGLAGYEASKQHGVKELQRTLGELTTVCADSRFILFGYSQGADVTATTWSHLTGDVKEKISKVILFADPRHNPDDVSHKGGGNLGGILPLREVFHDSKVESWCAPDDYVCSNTESRTAKIAIEKHLHGGMYDEWELTVASNLYSYLTSPQH